MRRSRDRTRGTRRQEPLRERLFDLEDDLAETKCRLRRLETTFESVLRETDGISIAGPCRCGEGLLVVRRGAIHCPACHYRRTI